MKSVPVDDLPEEYARKVADYAARLRVLAEASKTGLNRTPTPEDFHVWPLGVKGQITRKEIYEDV